MFHSYSPLLSGAKVGKKMGIFLKKLTDSQQQAMAEQAQEDSISDEPFDPNVFL